MVHQPETDSTPSFPELAVLEAIMEGGWWNPRMLNAIEEQLGELEREEWNLHNERQQTLARGHIDILPLLQREWAQLERGKSDKPEGGITVHEPWRKRATNLLLRYVELVEALQKMYGANPEEEMPLPGPFSSTQGAVVEAVRHFYIDGTPFNTDRRQAD